MNLAKKIYDKLNTQQILIAQHDYERAIIDDLCFKKNDKFECLSAYNTWLRVRNCKTKEEGFVPRGYLVPVDGKKIEYAEWYHGNLSRLDAEDLLEHEAPGTFLVRKTELNHAYSLSIKAIICVVHYKVFKKRGKYFLSEELKKKSLITLINAYLYNDKMGLYQHLISPCPKPKPKIYDLCGKYRMSYEIDREEITTSDEIGKGSFGVVTKGKWRDEVIAVKTLLKFNYDDFIREVEPLKLLQHEHIVNLYGVCTRDEPFLILFEYAELGSLESYLKNNPFVTDKMRLRFIQQVCSGMAYISRKNVVHRDIAARNILVKKNLKVLIADFGLSRITGDGMYLAKTTGAAYRWQALESFDQVFTCKSDVWSFGILVIEIFTQCENPYANLKGSLEVRRFLESGKRLDRPTKMPCKIYKKVKDCWLKDPQVRPNFVELQYFFNELLLETC